MTNNTRDRSGWIYFVRSGDAIKIGFSTDPKRRAETLQISHHAELEVLATVSTDVIQEKETHAIFSHLRIRGEWFRADPELLSFIASVSGRPEIIAAPVPEPEPVPPLPVKETPPYLAHLAEIQAMSAKLTKVRVAHGAETSVGYRCSNILEQFVGLPDYIRPEWATDERQTLPYMIKKQTEELERLRRAFQ